MSHYLTLVLVPHDTPDCARTVQTQLAPYDEAIQVPPYVVPCACIGHLAEQAARAIADQNVEPWHTLYTRYHAMPPSERPALDVWMAAWNATVEQARKAHPLDQRPDPTCPECDGTGLRTTTYNPESHWDYWRIGGRWDGWLSPNNLLPACDAAAAHKIPFALLEPDGTWHDLHDFWHDPWHAHREKAEAAWESKVESLLRAHPDTIAVACDLHI